MARNKIMRNVFLKILLKITALSVKNDLYSEINYPNLAYITNQDSRVQELGFAFERFWCHQINSMPNFVVKLFEAVCQC